MEPIETYTKNGCQCGATRVTEPDGRTTGWHACALCTHPNYRERNQAIMEGESSNSWN